MNGSFKDSYLDGVLKYEQIYKIQSTSGFQRAFLESITFIIRLMPSIIWNLEIKIYVV